MQSIPLDISFQSFLFLNCVEMQTSITDDQMKKIQFALKQYPVLYLNNCYDEYIHAEIK